MRILPPASEVPPAKNAPNANTERIMALLKADCLNFDQIGERVGLSRERVRQIAERAGMLDGNSRRTICRLDRELNSVIAGNSFLAECQRRGFSIEKVNRSIFYFYINNHSVILCRASMKQSGYYVIRGPRIEAEYAAHVASPDVVFIIPREAWPLNQTMFSLAPKHHGNYSKRHDWPNYLNAFNLLEESK